MDTRISLFTDFPILSCRVFHFTRMRFSAFGIGISTAERQSHACNEHGSCLDFKVSRIAVSSRLRNPFDVFKTLTK